MFSDSFSTFKKSLLSLFLKLQVFKTQRIKHTRHSRVCFGPLPRSVSYMSTPEWMSNSGNKDNFIRLSGSLGYLLSFNCNS